MKNNFSLAKNTAGLILVCIFLIVKPATSQQAAYNPSIDVLHYEFNIGLSDHHDTLHGRAVITVKFTGPGRQVWFDLKNINDTGRGMMVYAVKENGNALGFSHKKDSLIIRLGAEARTGAVRKFEIIYAGIPADGLIISKNKAGKRTIFGDNWPNRGRHWLPCKDHLSDKAAVDFIVTAPDHYRVVSNGVRVEEAVIGDRLRKTHWKETAPLPTKIMVIGVADFAVSDPVYVDSIPVDSWIFSEFRGTDFADYAVAPAVLRFFIENIGPYSYKKLSNVQSRTIFGGMENAGAIFYAENTVPGKKKATGLIAHEIAHQWFGDAATEKDWPHIWLSEGFASQMSQVYLSKVYGTDTLVSMLAKNRETILAFTKKTGLPVVDTSKGRDIMGLLNTNSYQKGGWVLHMLNMELGDELFWKCIRAYYAAYRDKNASSEDFQKIVEKTTARKMDVFFRQWLYVPENPAFHIGWKYDAQKKQLVVQVDQQTNHIFSVPLEVAITDAAGNKMVRVIRTSKRTGRFTIPVENDVVGFEADPNCKLLFEANITRTE